MNPLEKVGSENSGVSLGAFMPAPITKDLRQYLLNYGYKRKKRK